MSTVTSTPSILFTIAAADRVAELIAEEQNPKLNLRVYIIGGGCSGYKYAFTFDKTIVDTDTVITQTCSDGKTQVRLLVDLMSYPFLNQAEIDYVKNEQGEQFIIRNPNAKTTCGCGSSFSIDEES